MSSPFVDPRKDPNRWLAAVLLDLLEQDTTEAKVAVTLGIQTIVNYLEPGLIDQAFGPWIDQYVDLLTEHENNQSNVPQPYLPTDQKVSPE